VVSCETKALAIPFTSCDRRAVRMARLFTAWRNSRIQDRTRDRMTTPQQSVQQVPVGALYGLPGFTERFEQYENLYNVSTTGQQNAQTPFAPSGSFQKTDIVFSWALETFWTQTSTFSVGVLAYSPEAPYNLFQGPRLRLQGQYTPIEMDSGFHQAFFQMYRPSRGRGQRNVQDLMTTNPVPSTGFANPGIPQANLGGAVVPAALTSPVAITNYPLIIEYPAGLFLDEYWDLAIDGSLLPNAQGVVAPSAAFVSPQYMGGGERVIVPQFNLSAGIAATYDQGPIAATTAATLTAFSETVLINARRMGVFASENPAELPPVFNWQYRRASKRYPLGAITKTDIQITEYGQVLSLWAIIFDPALGTNNVGGYYNVANITKCQVLYGSNLPRFDDDVATMQDRFVEQHGFLPPQGCVVWDLAATGFNDNLSNARALNTLTNSNTHIHLEVSSAPSASAYAEVGVELLVPVSVQ
jgi:hypothetical protein